MILSDFILLGLVLGALYIMFHFAGKGPAGNHTYCQYCRKDHDKMQHESLPGWDEED